MGYGTAVVLGHKEYYPRFGYRKAIDLGIEFPFEVSHEYCMVAELIPGATENVKGMVYSDSTYSIGRLCCFKNESLSQYPL